MKHIRIIFLIFITMSSVSVFGQELPASRHEEISRVRIIDNAGLLNASEKTNLTQLINSVVNTYGFDIVIVTERSIGGASAVNYADDFFDYNGYGLGIDRDGCLFLQVTGTMDYWLSSSGRGNKILHSYAGQKLEKDLLKFLREDNYYEAYRSFILNWEKFLAMEADGRSFNFFYRYNIQLVIAAWLIAFLIALAVIQAWKKSMNTAFEKKEAAVYMINGSLSFTTKKDQFLYSVVSKTRKQTQSGSGGGLHRSSSGRMHGGRGGRY